MKMVRLKVYKYLVLSLAASMMLTACLRDYHPAVSSEERDAVNKTVAAVRQYDSLAVMQQDYESEGNALGSMVCLREMGKRLRNESRFSEALRLHEKGLGLAIEASDTLEWVQALNNLGTDCRRMGMLAQAHHYHLEAARVCDNCSDTSSAFTRNRAASLNGLGNIFLSTGNYHRADSVFRKALVFEKQLGNLTGQAINFANLGSIFARKGQTDSAWVYYGKSMECNKAMSNFFGIALCHTYFGHLYEDEGRYALAAEEYQTACDLLTDSKDDWHILNSLVSLAGVNMKLGKVELALEQLAASRESAEKIDSPDHLETIEHLYYEYYKSRGDHSAALAALEKSTEIGKSILNESIVEDIDNASMNFERESLEKQSMNLDTMLRIQKAKISHERMTFIVLFILLAMVAMLMFLGMRYRAKSLRMSGQLSDMRDSFFSNVTHESRTPLTVILGLSRDIQEDQNLPDQVRDKARTIERQGQKMLTLVNQILDVSKVKSALGNPEWQNSDIITYLSMVVETYRPYADTRGIGLRFFNYGPETVMMDFVPDYVSKTINNLLSNAFKYTHEGGRIEVRVAGTEKMLNVEVADSGIGIDDEAKMHIFEPYYQSSPGMRAMGTGIGLTLVKQIVDAVDGKISVESTLGKGSVFHLSIPIRNECADKKTSAPVPGTPLIPEDDDLQHDASANEVTNDDECRVLVVDDNLDVAAYIGSELPDSYSVYYAADGEEGFRKTLELTPDIVITDWMMPKMSGLDFCRSIRANDIINHIPVVLITARTLEEDRIQGTKAGVDAYLTKPFNPEELRAVVENLLEHRRMLRDKYRHYAVRKVVRTDNPESAFLANISESVKNRMERGEKIDVPQIAFDLNMSTSQLYRKVKSVSGYSPAEYFQRIKVAAAQELICSEPDLSLSDVSDRCGFNDYSSFLRAFKSVIGQTPSEYRDKRITLLLQGDGQDKDNQ